MIVVLIMYFFLFVFVREIYMWCKLMPSPLGDVIFVNVSLGFTVLSFAVCLRE